MRTPTAVDAHQARFQITQIKKLSKVEDNIALAQVWALLAVADAIQEVARAIKGSAPVVAPRPTADLSDFMGAGQTQP